MSSQGPDEDDRKTRSRGKKFLIWSGVALVVIALVVAAFYKLESVRAERVWASLMDELRIAGEPTSLREAIAMRPTIPEGAENGANFCDHPLIAAHENFDRETKDDTVPLDQKSAERFEALEIPSGYSTSRPFMAAAFASRSADLQAWRQWLTGTLPDGERGSDTPFADNPDLSDTEMILLALNARGSDHLGLVRAANESTHARFPIRLTGDEHIAECAAVRVPHYNHYTNFTKAASLRASAALAAGDPQLARDSLAVAFRLMDAIDSDMTVISMLVRMTGEAVLHGAVWDGLESGAWRDEDLEWLREVYALRPDSIKSHSVFAFRSEMAAMGMGIYVMAQEDPKELAETVASIGGGDSAGVFLFGMIPEGWMVFNAERASRCIFERQIQPLRSENFRLDGIPPSESVIGRKGPRNLLAALIVPVYDSLIHRVGEAVTAARLIEAACEIELEYRDSGSYPETVSDLAVDPLAERRAPIQYERLKDGFLLWGVGSNLTDEGGTVAVKSSGVRDRKNGDLVLEILRNRPQPVDPDAESQ